ncbi:MAG: hydroxyacid dehydrogenase [Acidimicrobiia bacterium]|nr:hydroxyacid dehydrogenase [Acidimicrobiia bacterium]
MRWPSPPPASEAEGLIWADPQNPHLLGPVLDAAPQLHWIQLPYAGIEPYLQFLDGERLWTCGKGVYAEPVAEMALSMLLAGMRSLTSYIGARSWLGPEGRNLRGANVAILGGGGITSELLKLLEPFDCDTTVLRRHPAPMQGASVVGIAGLTGALAAADAVVVALALTPETRGIIDAAALDVMTEHCWLVNVARGEHIVTDDLVAALRSGGIAGAGLDVTDPEPLPDGHALWDLPNCIITPHVGNTPEMGLELLDRRVTENVRRYGAGEPLLGPVDVALGY